MGITPREFKQMQDRVQRPARSAMPVFESQVSHGPKQHEIILGLDPSLRGTGFGIVRVSKPSVRALTYGTIRCPANWERSRCLAKISQDLRDLLKQFQPRVCAVEGLFFAQ